jgi:hypothetical protein
MARTRSVVLALLLLALGACKKAPDAAPAASSAAPAASGSSSAVGLETPPPGTLFPTGVMLSGDRASLQHYLRYVDTVIGAKVRLKYAPGAVVLDRDAAIRALHSASWDGVTWRFDASEPSVQKLKPGSVLLVWGLAIRKVTRVERAGDELVVTSDEAQLTDLVTSADIAWNAPAHMRQGAMAMRVPKPVDSVTFRSASFGGPRAPASYFRFASFADDSASPDTSPPAQYQKSFKIEIAKYAVAIAYGAPSEDQLNFYAQFAYGEEAEEPVGFPAQLGEVTKKAGKFVDWAKDKQEEREKESKEAKKQAKAARDGGQTMSGPGPGLRQAHAPTSEEQHKQKAEEEEEAEYEKKYGKQSRNSTSGMPKLPQMPKVPASFGEGLGSAWKELAGRSAIKVTGVGTVTGLRSQGDIEIEGGKVKHAMFSNPEFHLQGDIMWSARIDIAVFAGHTHVEVPVTFRVPLIIGGLPFFLELAINAQIQPAITSKMATAKGQRHIDFTKSAQLTISSGDVSAGSEEPTIEAQKGPEEKITGLGVSGLMIALQVPRVGFGFGFYGTNAMGYFDVVVASGATYTGTTGIIQCTKEILTASFNYGYSASFLGFPVYDKRYTGPHKEFEWNDPEGRNCPA